MNTNHKIAIRNVHKNMRTTWLNGLGISLTAIALILIHSLSRGVEEQMVKRSIRFETGAVTVQIKKELSGWENRPAGDSAYHVLTQYLTGDGAVKDYRPRIITHNALLYETSGTHRVNIQGLQEGEIALLGQMVEIMQGNTDWKHIPNGMIISRGLADEAALSIGDEYDIVQQSADGTINIQDFMVTGIFRNTSLQNKNTVYTTFQQAKSLYHTNLPTHLLIDLADIRQAAAVKQHLIRLMPGPHVEVTAYTDNLSRAKALSGINRTFMTSMAGFLLMISFIGIWAMQVENINQRRREIGTLLTFGFTPGAVKQIFQAETLYISVIYLVAGTAAVLSLITAVNHAGGVNLGESAAFAFGSSIVNPELRITDILLTAAIIILYPAVATWISLRTLNKKQIITLLNNN